MSNDSYPQPATAYDRSSMAVDPADGEPPRTLSLFPVIAGFLIVISLGAIALGLQRMKSAPPLPMLGSLPAFQFQAQSGKPFGTEQLEGKVWVANFIFTRCPTVCPEFTRAMAALQAKSSFGKDVHFVSFSVDPEFDTPERLAEYAKRYKANTETWSFLTGDPNQIKATVVDGLKISMGREPGSDDVMGIFHGTHFVLVDEDLQIRGYYNSHNPEDVDNVLRHAGQLLAD